METIKMKFKDAPVGARFKYPDLKSTWVKINHSGDGLVAEWHGNVSDHQLLACFADKSEGITLETEIELI